MSKSWDEARSDYEAEMEDLKVEVRSQSFNNQGGIMKKLLAILALAALVAGTFAATVMAATTPPLYGVNYYYPFQNGQYSTQVAKDLDELKLARVQSIRVTISDFDEVEYTNLYKRIATDAKAKGFETIWGVSTNAYPTTLTRWNAFMASIAGHAQWANDNGISYFSIGNEQENQADGTTLSVARVHSDLIGKAAEIKALYPNLKLTYAADQRRIAEWQDAGAFDTVGFNLYGPSDKEFTTAVAAVKANPKGIVTEWNTDNGINDRTTGVRGSDSRWATQLVKRRDWLNGAGLKSYLFLIRTNPRGVDETYQYGMWFGTTRKAAWKALIK